MIRTPKYLKPNDSNERGVIISEINVGNRETVRCWVVHFKSSGEIRTFRVGSVQTFGDDGEPF